MVRMRVSKDQAVDIINIVFLKITAYYFAVFLFTGINKYCRIFGQNKRTIPLPHIYIVDLNLSLCNGFIFNNEKFFPFLKGKYIKIISRKNTDSNYYDRRQKLCK